MAKRYRSKRRTKKMANDFVRKDNIPDENISTHISSICKPVTVNLIRLTDLQIKNMTQKNKSTIRRNKLNGKANRRYRKVQTVGMRRKGGFHRRTKCMFRTTSANTCRDGEMQVKADECLPKLMTRLSCDMRTVESGSDVRKDTFKNSVQKEIIAEGAKDNVPNEQLKLMQEHRQKYSIIPQKNANSNTKRRVHSRNKETISLNVKKRSMSTVNIMHRDYSTQGSRHLRSNVGKDKYLSSNINNLEDSNTNNALVIGTNCYIEQDNKKLQVSENASPEHPLNLQRHLRFPRKGIFCEYTNNIQDVQVKTIDISNNQIKHKGRITGNKNQASTKHHSVRSINSDNPDMEEDFQINKSAGRIHQRKRYVICDSESDEDKAATQAQTSPKKVYKRLKVLSDSSSEDEELSRKSMKGDESVTLASRIPVKRMRKLRVNLRKLKNSNIKNLSILKLHEKNTLTQTSESLSKEDEEQTIELSKTKSKDEISCSQHGVIMNTSTANKNNLNARVESVIGSLQSSSTPIQAIIQNEKLLFNPQITLIKLESLMIPPREHYSAKEVDHITQKYSDFLLNSNFLHKLRFSHLRTTQNESISSDKTVEMPAIEYERELYCGQPETLSNTSLQDSLQVRVQRESGELRKDVQDSSNNIERSTKVDLFCQRPTTLTTEIVGPASLNEAGPSISNSEEVSNNATIDEPMDVLVIDDALLHEEDVSLTQQSSRHEQSAVAAKCDSTEQIDVTQNHGDISSLTQSLDAVCSAQPPQKVAENTEKIVDVTETTEKPSTSSSTNSAEKSGVSEKLDVNITVADAAEVSRELPSSHSSPSSTGILTIAEKDGTNQLSGNTDKCLTNETVLSDEKSKREATKKGKLPCKVTRKKNDEWWMQRFREQCNRLNNLQCRVCLKDFETKENLASHLYQHTAEELQGTYEGAKKMSMELSNEDAVDQGACQKDNVVNAETDSLESAKKSCGAPKKPKENRKTGSKKTTSQTNKAHSTAAESETSVVNNINQAEGRKKKRKRKQSKEQKVDGDNGKGPAKPDENSKGDISSGQNNLNSGTASQRAAKSISICQCHRNEMGSVGDDALRMEMVLLCRLCQVLYRSMECFETHYRTETLCNQDRSYGRSPKIFCSGCRVVLNSLQDMRRHLEMHLKRNRQSKMTVVCNICKVLFFGVGVLFHTHWLKHVKNPFFVASPLSFPRTSVVHRKIRDTILISFSLDPRSETFSNYMVVAEYICRDCKAPFPTEKDLRYHVQNECAEARRYYQLMNSVSNTQETVTLDPKLYPSESGSPSLEMICGDCDQIFSDRAAYEEHALRHKDEHKLEPQYLKISVTAMKCAFICQVCANVFETLKELGEHWSRHVDVRKDFICTRCNARFASFDGFIDHAKNYCVRKMLLPSCRVSYHRPEYNCMVCHLVFDSQQSLNEHLNLHGQNIECVSKESLVMAKLMETAALPTPNITVALNNPSGGAEKSATCSSTPEILTVIDSSSTTLLRGCPPRDTGLMSTEKDHPTEGDKSDLQGKAKGTEEHKETTGEIKDSVEKENKNSCLKEAVDDTNSQGQMQTGNTSTAELIEIDNESDKSAVDMRNCEEKGQEKQKEHGINATALPQQQSAPNVSDLKPKQGTLRVRSLAELREKKESFICGICETTLDSVNQFNEHFATHVGPPIGANEVVATDDSVIVSNQANSASSDEQNFCEVVEVVESSSDNTANKIRCMFCPEYRCSVKEQFRIHEMMPGHITRKQIYRQMHGSTVIVKQPRSKGNSTVQQERLDVSNAVPATMQWASGPSWAESTSHAGHQKATGKIWTPPTYQTYTPHVMNQNEACQGMQVNVYPVQVVQGWVPQNQTKQGQIIERQVPNERTVKLSQPCHMNASEIIINRESNTDQRGNNQWNPLMQKQSMARNTRQYCESSNVTSTNFSEWHSTNSNQTVPSFVGNMFTCVHCPLKLRFENADRLCEHIAGYHNFRCETCNYRAYTSSELNIHRAAHGSTWANSFP